MTAQLSDAVRNAMADAAESTIGVSAKLQIRTGGQPANLAAADSGTLLIEYSLASDWMSAASIGVKNLSNLPLTGPAVASGLAGHFRIKNSAGSSSHIQGNVSQPWAASTVYATGQRVNLGGRVYNATTGGTSASSGGPTGTGGPITDGTVTWAYVADGPDMSLDNGNVASGQTVNVTAFSFTQGGA